MHYLWDTCMHIACLYLILSVRVFYYCNFINFNQTNLQLCDGMALTCLHVAFPTQEEEGDSFRSRQTHYERAWIFRKWYDFDVKYPFKKWYYSTCIL